VPRLAKKPEVREKVRQIQKSVGDKNTLVCEGRDTTSVVFPKAMFKFFLTASVNARADRRMLDLQSKGESVSIEELREQIAERDRLDMTRSESPLTQVADAIVIDATKINAYQVGKLMEKIITRELVKRCGYGL
jgi:cytidylate kinase